MLEAIRKVSHHPVFKILFGILLLSFALSGAGLTGARSLSLRGIFNSNYVVKVGREAITQDAIDKKYDETLRNLRRSGLDFTPEQLASYGISKGQTLRSLVQNSLIRQEVDSLGLEAGDDAVTDQIKNIPQFQTNGAFDREKFNATINSIGLTEAQFTNMLRAEIKNGLLVNTVTANIPVNDFIAAKQAVFNGEKRDIEIAIIPKSIKAPLSEPTDKDLKDFYFENSFQFQIPESRDINFIKLAKAKDNDAATYDMINKIEDELAGGSTLKEVADKLKLKLETKQGLHADDKEFSQLFMQTAFGKDKGQVSEVVHDDKSGEYFVIEVADVKPARIPDMSEVKDKVVAAWKDSSANDQNLKYIQKMADELKASHADLKNFASANGYKYEVLKDVKRSDTETDGARLVNDAFAGKIGGVLGSYQNEDGTYKIARLKDVRETALSPAEKAKYKDELADEVKVEIMDQFFEALRKKYPVKENAAAIKTEKKDKAISKETGASADQKTPVITFKK